MNHAINQLIQYGLDRQLIQEADRDYATNLLLDLLNINEFEREDIHEVIGDCTPILEKMLNYAVEQGIIEDSIVEKDLFDTRLMNCLMPRPSEVVQTFYRRYAHSPQKATQYFYNLSIDSHYIRKDRTDQNIRFQKYYKYGLIDITINLSKPEKDPKDIAKAKLVKTSGYPKCLLCKENVGFSGDFNRPARQNHRIIPLKLNNTDYYLQYSPYVYYNEHCIVLNKEHIPMVINQDTFQHLLSFVEQFPHYMLGSNADLPIVGGSILTHDHFQGGCYEFAMNNADVIQTLTFEDFNSTEKIATLPSELNVDGLPSGYTPEVGDFSYYAPWGNVSVFYKDFRYSNSLYKLGTIESGTEILGNISGNFEVTIERVS